MKEKCKYLGATDSVVKHGIERITLASHHILATSTSIPKKKLPVLFLSFFGKGGDNCDPSFAINFQFLIKAKILSS